jgi:hypothetical protein
VLFTNPDRFSAIGRSKWRWFLIELTAFIPHVGFIAVLCYVFMVRVPCRTCNGAGTVPA